MDPNLLLLALSPNTAGNGAAAKPALLHQVYDFIVQPQNRRAEYEVARHVRGARKGGASRS